MGVGVEVTEQDVGMTFLGMPSVLHNLLPIAQNSVWGRGWDYAEKITLQKTMTLTARNSLCCKQWVGLDG